jgi:hypothetical protein
LPKRQDEAPGLAEGEALGAVVGTMLGKGLGGVVGGVEDPPQDRVNARTPTTGRVRQGIIFIPLVTPIRSIRIFDGTAAEASRQAGVCSGNSRHLRGLD